MLMSSSMSDVRSGKRGLLRYLGALQQTPDSPHFQVTVCCVDCIGWCCSQGRPLQSHALPVVKGCKSGHVLGREVHQLCLPVADRKFRNRGWSPVKEPMLPLAHKKHRCMWRPGHPAGDAADAGERAVPADGGGGTPLPAALRQLCGAAAS